MEKQVSLQWNYFTRGASAQQLLIPFSRINIRKFCPTVIGKYYWNALPVCIRDLTTKAAFKSTSQILSCSVLICFLTAFSSVSVCVPCVCVCTLCFVMCIILYKRAIVWIISVLRALISLYYNVPFSIQHSFWKYLYLYVYICLTNGVKIK